MVFKLFTVIKLCIYPTSGCYTGKMVFTNASQIKRNWFLTLHLNNYLQFTKVGTRKFMDVVYEYLTLYNIFVYPLFIHFFIYTLVWKKENFHSYTNLISEVININFWQIWHFDVTGTGWVDLELSIIFTQTVWRFDMWVTPYMIVLTFAKLKYFMPKDLSTKPL